jgi:hypothetical protein
MDSKWIFVQLEPFVELGIEKARQNVELWRPYISWRYRASLSSARRYRGFWTAATSILECGTVCCEFIASVIQTANLAPGRSHTLKGRAPP